MSPEPGAGALAAAAKAASGGHGGLAVGLRFRVAPRFHDSAELSERLALGGGAALIAGRPEPHSDWRAELTDGELRCLLASGEAGGPGGESAEMLGASEAGLILLPLHLREAWWALAEGASADEETLPGFEGFAAEAIAFLRFKRLPLPEPCSCQVVAIPPGRAAAGLDAEPRLRCAINLGDEAMHLVLLDLTERDARARLAVHGAPAAREATPAAVWASFFGAFATYPMIRFRLGSGEGLWLPDDDLLVDATTRGSIEAAVLLTLRAAP